MRVKEELGKFDDVEKLSRKGKEGIVILQCCEELRKWVEEITKYFIADNILPKGTLDENVWGDVFMIELADGRRGAVIWSLKVAYLIDVGWLCGE